MKPCCAACRGRPLLRLLLRKPHRQFGQAMVETVVLAAALVPLLLAIPLLAKYQDIRHAAVAASRTAAFECSVRPDSCAGSSGEAALADDLRRRHFARHDRDLFTADAMAQDAPGVERNRFWVDRRGANLLASPSDVTVNLRAGDSDALQGAWSRGAAGAPGSGGSAGSAGSIGSAGSAALAVAAAGPGAFGLETGKGLLTAQVRARVSVDRTLAQWLARPEGMRLALTGKTAVIVDSWNASEAKGSDPRSFETRTELGRRLPDVGATTGILEQARRAAPAGALETPGGAGAEDVIDALYSPIRLLITGPLLAPVEPRGRLFRYHEIDVDVVPQDRVRQP